MEDQEKTREQLVDEVRELRKRLSEAQSLEQELLNAKKLEAIGVLAGGIAHDFNNLLFVILGNIRMAEMKLAAENAAMKHLVEASTACMRARDLTQKFITFSSGGGTARTRVNVRELVEDAVSLALSGSNFGSSFRFAEDLWPAEIDEQEMRQAITGIIVNSREAMPCGGEIRVRAENVEIGNGDTPLNCLKEGRYVRIRIEDKGVGIPQENLDKIFDPYFSTKYRGSQKGMGFGLAIAHSVVKRNRGHIKVESSLGEGTTVSILIPASTARDAAPVEKAGSCPEGRKRILLMDDEEMLADLAKTMLEHLGYEAGVALNGEQAVEMYAEAMEQGREFHAVILDLTVKGGMGGKEAMKKLLYLNPNVKAVVSSGYLSDPAMSDCTGYGFKATLSKPYAMERLKEVLESLLY